MIYGIILSDTIIHNTSGQSSMKMNRLYRELLQTVNSMKIKSSACQLHRHKFQVSATAQQKLLNSVLLLPWREFRKILILTACKNMKEKQ